MHCVLLQKHNEVRSLVSEGSCGRQPKGNVKPLVNIFLRNTDKQIFKKTFKVWDDDLARYAESYATKCIPAHNKENQKHKFGENLFRGPYAQKMTPEFATSRLVLAVEAFAIEHKYYKFGQPTQFGEQGQKVGHFTQVYFLNYIIGLQKYDQNT